MGYFIGVFQRLNPKKMLKPSWFHTFRHLRLAILNHDISDILGIDILMKMGSWHSSSFKMWYMMGRYTMGIRVEYVYTQ